MHGAYRVNGYGLQMISPERLRQLRTDGRTGYEAPTQEPAESATKTDEAPTRELELTAPTETPMTTPTKNHPPFQRISTPTKGRPSLQSFSNRYPTTDNYFQTIILRRGDDDWKKGHRTKTSAPTLTPTEGKQEALSPTEANTAHSNENSPLRRDSQQRHDEKENKANKKRADAPTLDDDKGGTDRTNTKISSKTRAPTSTIAPTAN